MTDNHGNFYTPENSEFYSRFRYLDLDPESKSIRLLRIKPPTSPENVKTEMIQCDLLDNISLATIRGNYTTISYCAGDPKDIEKVIINGLSFNAFANLGHALRQARHFWKDKFDKHELLLWADQICINQDSPSERPHQVQLMGYIYSASKRVLVSLSTNHGLAGGLKWLSDTLDDMRRPGRLSFSLGFEHDGYHDYLSDNIYQKRFHLGWNTFIRTVLTSPWWDRAWVRQEFICSPDAHFMAAFESIHWKIVEEFIGIYYKGLFTLNRSVQRCPYQFSKETGSSDLCQICLLHNGSGALPLQEAVWPVNRLLKAKTSIEEQPKSSRDLLCNLRDAHFCKASDPRDLVYAFLGFSEHIYGVYPDYATDISLQDVFIQLACNVICHDQNLDILESAYLRRGPMVEVGPDLPSWAPDWRNNEYRGRDHLAKDRRSRTTAFVSFRPDEKGRKSRILQTRGVVHTVLRQNVSLGKFLSATGEMISVDGNVEEEDEVWVLDGANWFYILRRHGQCHEVVGELLDPPEVSLGLRHSLDEINARIISEDASVQSVSIR